jgi:MFS family permease
MLAVPLGGALSYFLSGPIAQAFGWRAGMMAAAAPALLLLPILLCLHEPVRGAAEVVRYTPAASVWSILRIPTLWWIIASGALVNFNMYAYGTFLPAFLARIHGVSLARSGITTGIIYAIGGIAGGTIAGSWGDRIIRRRANGRMLAGSLIALVGGPVAFFGIVQPRGSLLLAASLITLGYATLNSYYGLVYSSIQDIVAPEFRGTAMSVYFMIMYLGGASFGPLLTGSLSDHMARRAAAAAGSAQLTEAFKAIGLQQAMIIIPVLSIALAAVLYLGSRTIERDMRRGRASAVATAAL